MIARVSCPWIHADPLDRVTLAALRRRLMFEACKWDPQVEDVSALCETPLILQVGAWREIAAEAERLYRECLLIEAELLERPELWPALAIPRRICRAMRSGGRPVPGIARVMRFDFHWCADGWRISEVNSDVPGGYIEAGAFTRWMAEAHGGGRPTGDPADALASSLAERLPSGATVALVYATAYCDDAQVMVYLSQRLEAFGLRCRLTAPDVMGVPGDEAVMRFFPAEWLPQLSRTSRWERFFVDSDLPQCNPGYALLTQSKRWPVLWDRLRTPAPTWRRLLPPTRAVAWRQALRGGEWVLKPALGRVGDGVAIRDISESDTWKAVRWARWMERGWWVMQERFEPVVWMTHRGPRYPCIGVYVVDGRAAGAYGRAAERPLIDHRAQEVAVLVTQSGREPQTDDVAEPLETGACC